jgi:hypothetical protein
MTTPDNRRRHPRLMRQERLFIVLVAPGQAEELAGQTVYCATEDLSESGLKIRMQQPLPRGSHVDLWLKMGDHPGTFLLAAQVRWHQALSSGEFMLGLELADRLGTDNERWRAVVREYFEGGSASGD